MIQFQDFVTQRDSLQRECEKELLGILLALKGVSIDGCILHGDVVLEDMIKVTLDNGLCGAPFDVNIGAVGVREVKTPRGPVNHIVLVEDNTDWTEEDAVFEGGDEFNEGCLACPMDIIDIHDTVVQRLEDLMENYPEILGDRFSAR